MTIKIAVQRYFTLLEVIIALGLTTLILTTLLTSYYLAERSSAFWDHQNQELFAERYVQYRLGEVLGKLSLADQNKTFFFNTENTSGFFLSGTSSLTFSYDNGIVLDPLLSGSVMGTLYVNRKGELTLITWPDKKEWIADQLPSHHREVLIGEIKGMTFDYFLPPSENKEIQEIGWKGEGWTKELKHSPAIIKITLTKSNGKVIPYAFPVPELLTIVRLKK